MLLESLRVNQLPVYHRRISPPDFYYSAQVPSSFITYSYKNHAINPYSYIMIPPVKYLPLFFHLQEVAVLIIGGSEVALRKAELMRRAGAKVTVIAIAIKPALQDLVQQGGGRCLHRAFTARDVIGYRLVIAATSNMTTNTQVQQAASAAGVPVNVVDCPHLCDFIFPAIVDRSPVVAAISSSGASPVLARRLRTQLERLLPASLSRLAAFCQRMRDTVKESLPGHKRRLFWESFLDDAMSGDLSAQATAERFSHSLTQHAQRQADGMVFIIGAGPGSPDLLTLRALRLMQSADVVIYDRLASKEVIDLARRDAEKICVGKQRNAHLASQEEINALMIERARQGLRVARLKGGDPYIFGRGGEECAALQAAGLSVEVVPGITAAIGCAAAAGLPLTYRRIARSVKLCTVYQDDMYDAWYWQALARDTTCTLVFYMTGAFLAHLSQQLIAAGMPAQTPVAAICAGTTAAQQVTCGTLQTIAKRAEGRLFSPALIIVGDVCAFAADSTTDDAVIASPFLDITQKQQYAI